MGLERKRRVEEEEEEEGGGGEEVTGTTRSMRAVPTMDLTRVSESCQSSDATSPDSTSHTPEPLPPPAEAA